MLEEALLLDEAALDVELETLLVDDDALEIELEVLLFADDVLDVALDALLFAEDVLDIELEELLLVADPELPPPPPPPPPHADSINKITPGSNDFRGMAVRMGTPSPELLPGSPAVGRSN
ncbi:MAG: hypothetical protein QM808_05395 [Steroidobacteraceae bacterium]